MRSNPKSRIQNPKLALTRRAILQGTSMGLGSLALGWLLGQDVPADDATDVLAPRAGHLKARAKNVIFLHMVGAPSQLDLFDYKPTLQKFDGEKCPEHLLAGQRFAFLRGHPSLLGTKFKFEKHGQSGLEISENLPPLDG